MLLATRMHSRIPSANFLLRLLCFLLGVHVIDGRVAGKVGYNNNYYSGNSLKFVSLFLN